MATVIELNRHSKADRKRFLRLPYAIYREDPNWVPPLLMAQHILLTNKEPFYEHAETQLFMAVRDGRDVGRIAAIENRVHNEVHKDRVGFVGFFECENDPEAAKALFAAAEKWLAQRKLNVMRGPINLSTNHTIGLLVSGEPGAPMVDMTYNPHYYEDLFRHAGFTKAMDVVAHLMDVTAPSTIERLKKLSDRAMSKQKITTRQVDLKHFDQEITIIKQIYNAAWEKNWGFVPLNDKEFDHIAEDLKMVVDPGLIHFIFVDGKPAGVLVAILNINEILIKIGGRLLPTGLFKVLLGKSKIKSIRLLIMGLAPEYRQRGLETVMYYRALQHALAKGYTVCENSWLLETNEMVLKASKFMGGREYRRYRIFDRAIKPAPKNPVKK